MPHLSNGTQRVYSDNRPPTICVDIKQKKLNQEESHRLQWRTKKLSAINLNAEVMKVSLNSSADALSMSSVLRPTESDQEAEEETENQSREIILVCRQEYLPDIMIWHFKKMFLLGRDYQTLRCAVEHGIQTTELTRRTRASPTGAYNTRYWQTTGLLCMV